LSLDRYEAGKKVDPFAQLPLYRAKNSPKKPTTKVVVRALAIRQRIHEIAVLRR
jgi:hypothetical protein